MSMIGLRDRRTPSAADVAGMLAELGGTPADVARSLGDLGVHGVPADVHQCALAAYLHAVVGGDRHVKALNVWSDRIRITFGRFVGQPCEVPLSSCLREFIDRFDGLCYPDLVRKPASAIAAGSEWPA